MFDAKIASALKQILTSVHFRMRVSVEEERAQKDDLFLRGRQIAHMTHEHFRATGAHEAVQGPSDLFNTRLDNDNVQDFHTRWDQALLAASEIPIAMVLEGFYKSNYRILFSFRLCSLCMKKRMIETTNHQTTPD